MIVLRVNNLHKEVSRRIIVNLPASSVEKGLEVSHYNITYLLAYMTRHCFRIIQNAFL